ncbi:hypothetical protein N7470_006982 [Penicillium chermesinum]|nr:hypothetical protein N7470_006982 [Penicillium chermesinum]
MAVHQPGHRRKRLRASDAAEKASQSGDDQPKRRRVSNSHAISKAVAANTSEDPTESAKHTIPALREEETRNQGSWSLSPLAGGRYSSLDPLMTLDEAYLFIGLETAVQVLATSTNRVLRSLQVRGGQKVVGFRLCPVHEEVIYIFTPSSVSKWNWNSGQQLDGWKTNDATIAVDVPWVEEENEVFSYNLKSKGGKRQIVVCSIDKKSSTGVVVLETKELINKIQVVNSGKVIIASDGHRLFWGSGRTSDPINLVLGEANGSLLIFQDILNTLFGRNGDKKAAPRKLHWHRGPVSAVRWSTDGNYVVSGGNEPVLVIWQLDTGRKHTVPHLSSPISNIVVSPRGTSYVVQLADNSTGIFSTREIGSSVNIVGLQVSADGSKDLAGKRSTGAVAVLHPQHPEQLLVVVPSSHHLNQQSTGCSNSAVLQTYDIRANYHIARQALARTNTTTLNIGPEGSPIVTPDVQNMGILHDGNWLATVDSWSPRPHDVEAFVDKSSSRSATTLPLETYLKFWKWNPSASHWQLVTRIDGPHFKHDRHSPVLALLARPCCQEFVTIGADASLRFWCPAASHRASLEKKSSEFRHNTWKQRNSIDLTAYLRNASTSLKEACISFSEDGSVLAVCLPSESTVNAGLILLIDARACTVHYQRAGVFSGTPCSVNFLGRHLIVSSTKSVVVWDTVDDFVNCVRVFKSNDATDTPLVAANPRNQTFAITSTIVDDTNIAHPMKRGAKCRVQVYSIASLSLVFQDALGNTPLALLPDIYSGDYIILGSAATVQRVTCSDKASRQSMQPLDVASQLDTGLSSIFSQGHERASTRAIEDDRPSSHTKALSHVFDAPSFSLPPVGALFRSVVESLQSN